MCMFLTWLAPVEIQDCDDQLKTVLSDMNAFKLADSHHSSLVTQAKQGSREASEKRPVCSAEGVVSIVIPLFKAMTDIPDHGHEVHPNVAHRWWRGA